MAKADIINALQSAASIPDETAQDIFEHRQKVVKVPLTVRSAKAISKELAQCADIEAAVDTWLNAGWRGFRHEWLKQPARYQDTHNPSANIKPSVPMSFERPKNRGPVKLGETDFLRKWREKGSADA